jgi:hypothetical protein
LTALSRVRADVAGVASSLLNTGQQIGGSIGLAVLGTVAWTSVANSLRGAASYRHALAAGFSRGFEVAAGILLLALIVTITAIRVRRGDLDGTQGR